MISKPKTAKDALVLSAGAAVKREIATSMAERCDYHASWERAEADEMDEAADGRYSPASITARRQARQAIREIRALLRSAATTEGEMLEALGRLR